MPDLVTYLAWSPEGGRLLVARGRGELYVLDVRTRRMRQLTSGMSVISGMSWR
jgi:Tol biopolymer transport system component